MSDAVLIELLRTVQIVVPGVVTLVILWCIRSWFVRPVGDLGRFFSETYGAVRGWLGNAITTVTDVATFRVGFQAAATGPTKKTPALAVNLRH